MNLARVEEATARAAFSPAVDETAALRAFAKTLRRRPSGWLTSWRLLRRERVWLPFALVSAECGSSTAAKRLCCLVDRIEGSVFGLRDDLDEPVLIEVESPLPPQLDLDECRPLAERFLRRRMLIARTECELAIGTSEKCLYPFWAAYFERRRRRIEVRLLDAVTGDPSGAGLRTAFLSGLRAAANGDAPAA